MKKNKGGWLGKWRRGVNNRLKNDENSKKLEDI